PKETESLCKSGEHARAYALLQTPGFTASGMKDTLEERVRSEWVKQAQQCLAPDQKDFHRAAEMARQVLQRNPDYARAQRVFEQATKTMNAILQRRDELLEKGEFIRALRHVADAWPLAEREQRAVIIEVWIRRVEILFDKAEIREAEKSLNELLDQEPG